MIFRKVLLITYKIFNKAFISTKVLIAYVFNFAILYIHNIEYGKNLVINGFIKLIINKRATVKIGNNFKLNSGKSFNPIGRNQRSLFVVNKNAVLIIGDNVGMSSVAIVCAKKIVFGSNIKVGGNTVFYDTDFHSLNYEERTSSPELKKNIKVKPIFIHDNVFIGGHSIILKGTVIGKNTIIGAGSVVAGKVPSNEIWAGNPAKFIKKIDD
jgi:acetyltransferase-like isoleucine patch superfamily enzyme